MLTCCFLHLEVDHHEAWVVSLRTATYGHMEQRNESDGKQGHVVCLSRMGLCSFSFWRISAQCWLVDEARAISCSAAVGCEMPLTRSHSEDCMSRNGADGKSLQNKREGWSRCGHIKVNG